MTVHRSILLDLDQNLINMVGEYAAKDLVEQATGNIGKIPVEFQPAARAWAQMQVRFDIQAGQDFSEKDLREISRAFTKLVNLNISPAATLNQRRFTTTRPGRVRNDGPSLALFKVYVAQNNKICVAIPRFDDF